MAGGFPPHREQWCGRASKWEGEVSLHLPLFQSLQGSRLSLAALPLSWPLPLPLPLPLGLSPLGRCQHDLAVWPGFPQMVQIEAGGLSEDAPADPPPLPLPLLPPSKRGALLPFPLSSRLRFEPPGWDLSSMAFV